MTDQELAQALRDHSAKPHLDRSTAHYLRLAADRIDPRPHRNPRKEQP